MKLLCAFLCIALLAGCATTSTSPPAVGSNPWHEQRIADVCLEGPASFIYEGQLHEEAL